VPKLVSRSFLERNTIEGDSPVDKTDMVLFNRVGLPRKDVRIWLD
jgi:hypothetical protein